MSWSALVITGLKLSLMLLSYIKERQLLKAGQDKAIAEAALKVLEATEHGKRLRERIRMMEDSEADKLWNELINV